MAEEEVPSEEGQVPYKEKDQEKVPDHLLWHRLLRQKVLRQARTLRSILHPDHQAW